MDPHEYLRNDVRRIYGLSGLADKDEFESIDNMSIRMMYKKALLWYNMIEYSYSERIVKCKCGVINKFEDDYACGDIVGRYYPDFIAIRLNLPNRIAYVNSSSNNEIYSCNCKINYKLYSQPDKGIIKAQITIRTLKGLVKLEDSQTTPVLAQKVDELTEELSKKEQENKRLMKIIETIKGNLN